MSLKGTEAQECEGIASAAGVTRVPLLKVSFFLFNSVHLCRSGGGGGAVNAVTVGAEEGAGYPELEQTGSSKCGCWEPNSEPRGALTIGQPLQPCILY